MACSFELQDDPDYVPEDEDDDDEDEDDDDDGEDDDEDVETWQVGVRPHSDPSPTPLAKRADVA